MARDVDLGQSQPKVGATFSWCLKRGLGNTGRCSHT